MAVPGGQWDLQEAITELWTATRTATTPLVLYLDKIDRPSTSITTRSSSNQRSGDVTVYNLRVVEGTKVIKQIAISKLLAGDHEIRLVPPTRATLLFSDPDGPRVAGRGQALDSQSQNGSQEGSSQSKRTCFLKLCFHSLGDLKAVSKRFFGLGLRCTTPSKPQNRPTLSRTSSLTSPAVSSQMGPVARQSFPAFNARGRDDLGGSVLGTATAAESPTRAQSYQTGPATTLKRTYTDMTPLREAENAPRRRQSAAASTHDILLSKRLRWKSSPTDVSGAPWNKSDSWSKSRPYTGSPTVSRFGSESQDGPTYSPYQAGEVAEPPPRRELPKAVVRLMSQTPSQADGNDETADQNRFSRGSGSRSTSVPSRKIAVTESEMQTEAPFVEAEWALFAGMQLFHELTDLRDQALKECIGATRKHCADGDDEAEARIVARYAIEFGAQFMQRCEQQVAMFPHQR